MPFDGTFNKEFLVLDVLRQARSHLSHRDKWMKADLTDGRDRFCLVGAIMHYASNDSALLDLALNVVSKQIDKKYEAQSPSARVMRYNDAKAIHHHHVVRTLDRAIKGIVQDNARVSKR